MINCINCGKELSKWAKYEKNDKCRSCSHKWQNILNHKINCQCGVCKAIRGETKGIPKSEETKVRLREAIKLNPNRQFNFKNGKDNFNYVDGNGYAPYPRIFTEQLKEEIRQRDDYICQNCDMTDEEHLIVIGKSLEIHHIDYNKENCKKDNLITLCKQCNLRANANRNYWQEFYQNKIITNAKAR